MKTKKFFVLFAALLPSIAFAQLKVNSYGNTSLGTNDDLYRLNVKSNSYASFAAKIVGENGSSLWIDNDNPSSISTSGYGIYLMNEINTSSESYGLYSHSKNLNTSSTSAKSIGVYGLANSSSNVSAYGVAGTVTGTSGVGAGIFGGDMSMFVPLDGKYAGYFSGNVKVTGLVNGTLINSSDARLKENVQALDESLGSGGTSILEQLDMLTPVSFNYKKIEETKDETMREEGEEEAEELPNPVMEKEHFGLIAQELQEVYPNLVYEQDNGYLAVNYTELIPVLVQAIKELKKELDEVKGNGAARKAMAAKASAVDTEAFADVASMNQNVPNPFTEKTDIAINLPETVQTATLYIYDLSGKQLEQHPITGRGDTVMTIHADKMEAGMYVYSLVADQKIVTTKKMIVTK